MAVHLVPDELEERRARAIDAALARGLDGLLPFRQESMYYLTGYDTFGYFFFHRLWLGIDGTTTLLTRAPDLRRARHTSVIGDVRVWTDGGADLAAELPGLREEHGCRGRRLGIELDAHGLAAALWSGRVTFRRPRVSR